MTNELKPLTAGQAIKIKPEFQDAGDDRFEWVVIEDRGDRVLVVCSLQGFPIRPSTVLARHMIQD